jgi:hypothetical protein
VAYVDEDSVYGFNGKHLGWFRGGAVYDHGGSIVAAFADRFRTPVSVAPDPASMDCREEDQALINLRLQIHPAQLVNLLGT